MSGATPKPKKHLPTPKNQRSTGSQWGKHPTIPVKPKPPKIRDGEPRTLEGRARKKIQFGLLHGMGCVLTYGELLEVLKVVPTNWVEKECV